MRGPLPTQGGPSQSWAQSRVPPGAERRRRGGGGAAALNPPGPAPALASSSSSPSSTRCRHGGVGGSKLGLLVPSAGSYWEDWEHWGGSAGPAGLGVWSPWGLLCGCARPRSLTAPLRQSPGEPSWTTWGGDGAVGAVGSERRGRGSSGGVGAMWSGGGLGAMGSAWLGRGRRVEPWGARCSPGGGGLSPKMRSDGCRKPQPHGECSPGGRTRACTRNRTLASLLVLACVHRGGFAPWQLASPSCNGGTFVHRRVPPLPCTAARPRAHSTARSALRTHSAALPNSNPVLILPASPTPPLQGGAGRWGRCGAARGRAISAAAPGAPPPRAARGRPAPPHAAMVSAYPPPPPPPLCTSLHQR